MRPSQYASAANAEHALDQLDERLDDLLARWRGALQDNLRSETSQRSLQAMTPGERLPIEEFLTQPEGETRLPDGTKLLVPSDREGDYDIYVVNADGSVLTRLTHDPGFDSSPTWSPDGKKIAFTTDRDGNVEIYVMNADGTNETNVTNSPDDDWLPAWRP